MTNVYCFKLVKNQNQKFKAISIINTRITKQTPSPLTIANDASGEKTTETSPLQRIVLVMAPSELRTTKPTKAVSPLTTAMQPSGEHTTFSNSNVPLQTREHALAGISGMLRLRPELKGHLRPEALNLKA